MVPQSILESAWQLTVDYDYNAGLAVRRHMRLRRIVIILGVAATLLAILSDSFGGTLLPVVAEWILRVLLILVPITSSVVLALANRFQEGERWLALKTGAENVMRVIYLSRTILSPVNTLSERQKHMVEFRRDQWLEERLAEIRRETLQNVSGNLALRSYPWRSRWQFAVNPLGGLEPEEYIEERLNYEIDDYSKKIARAQTVRTNLQYAILILGGIGSLIAALSNMSVLQPFSLSIWVALSTAFAVAVSSWFELREMDWRVHRGISPEDREKALNGNSEKTGSRGSVDDPLEATVTLYSHIINELTIARDHWRSLGKEGGTDEFYELVLLVERILWGKEFPLDSQIQECINQLNSSPATGESGQDLPAPEVEAGTGKGLAAEPQQAAGTGEAAPVLSVLAREENGKPVQGKRVQLKPRRVVVLMPSGRKVTPGGLRIDYDHVYNRLIEQAMPEGFSVYRWTRNKAIDSVQELLLADIVIADIGLDDPDVFYNLAIRHAYRKQGIIHIREIKLRSSFRTFNVRTADYHCNKYGRIDSAKEAADQKVLLDLVWNISDSQSIDNPVFNLLPEMREPELRYLQAPSAVDFWYEDEQRRQRLAIAQKQRRIGDILLLTEEIHNPMVKEDAYKQAGQALKDMGRHDLAINWYRLGRDLNPNSLCFRREEAFSLNRLKKPKEAIVKLESLLEENPGDWEAIAYLGRIYKDVWYDSWREVPDLKDRRQKAFDNSHWLLKSFETYLKGYRYDLNRPHPGTNAFTLGMAYVRLERLYATNDAQDAYLTDLERDVLPRLKDTLTFSLETRIRHGKADYQTLVALAELCAMTSSSPQEIRQSYRQALMGTRRTQFRMQSSLRQLRMLQELGLPGLCLEAGIQELLAELEPSPSEKGASPSLAEALDVNVLLENQPERQERKVFLFNGDTGSASASQPASWDERFVDQIQKQIQEGFDEQKVKKGDPVLVIATGMGSATEILFVEYCVKQGFLVQAYFPRSKEYYISNYVWHGGDWEERFENLCNNNLVDDYYQDSSVGLPREKEKDKIFERNARWAKHYAQVYGREYRHISIVNPEAGCPQIKFASIKNRNADTGEPIKSPAASETGVADHPGSD